MNGLDQNNPYSNGSDVPPWAVPETNAQAGPFPDPQNDPLGYLATIQGQQPPDVNQQAATQQDVLSNIAGNNSGRIPMPAPMGAPPTPPQVGMGGKLKSMLTNFLSGMGESMMHSAGIETPDEKQARLFHQSIMQKTADASLLSAQSLEGLRQSQAKQNELTQFQLPDGSTIMVNAAGAAKLGSAQYSANPRLAALGLNPDGSPMDQSQLSPIQRQNLRASQALTDLNQAKAELAQAGNDPDSPLFKQKQAEFQQKLDVLHETLGLRRDMFGLAQQRNNALYGNNGSDGMERLSPTAQKVLMESEPTHDQIKQLMATFESMKDDNTPLKFAGQRALYSVGVQSPIGEAGDTIAKLELNRIVGAARVLKGSSRAIQALEMALRHTPNVWVDSPKMIYSKLANLDQALEQIKNDAYTYGQKSGAVPPRNNTAPQAKSFSKSAWLKANPGGNVEGAAALAKSKGIAVIQ